MVGEATPPNSAPVEPDHPGGSSVCSGGEGKTGRWGLCVALLLAVYAAGLTHDLSKPWTGMHDWNGAFFSQLARNLLRYPVSVHHGMGVIAVGEPVPPPEERSIYASHPPALIWLVALAFRLLGESECVARLVPVLASLGSLALLIHLVRRAWGPETALLTGLLYAVMPMTVYFGRMVDHEPVCLFCMLAALACWQIATANLDVSRRQVLFARLGWVVAMFGAIWVDWPGVLFAGLFAIHVLLQFGRGRISLDIVLMGVGMPLLLLAGMFTHLVYGGLEGRWGDVLAIFQSRAVAKKVEVEAPFVVWQHTVGNVTWPMLLLAGAGFIRFLTRDRRQREGIHSCAGAPVHTQKVEASWVLPATGILWVCVFWRQYEIHNYWMFYLGLPIAVLAADTVLAVRDGLLQLGSRLCCGTFYVLLGAVVAFALRGTDDYFARPSRPSFACETATALLRVQQATAADDRVLLYEDIVFDEVNGGYHLRNLLPPQYAYYLDRAFDVERDLEVVARRPPGYAVFVMPMKDVAENELQVAGLRQRYVVTTTCTEVLVDLRSYRP